MISVNSSRDIRPIPLALLLPALLALSACAKDATPEERGKAVYASYDCKKCHRIGKVGGSLGPDLTFVGFRKDAAFLDLWLKDPGAWKEGVVMPKFFFKDHVRKDLAAYLATLQGKEHLEGVRPWDEGDLRSDPVKRGAALYAKVGCVSCHGKNGAGGYPNNNVVGGKIPALTKVAEGFSKEELLDKLRQGVPQSAKADPAGADPLLNMPAWGEKLKDDELGALADYLISLQPKTSGGEW
ncbi:MAG: cytochrome c [Elusimicrobiota bacterium]